MRLVTFNMRGGGSRRHWAELLKATRPDVAFVQETKAPAAFPPELLDEYDLSTAAWVPAPHKRWGTALWVNQGAVETIALSGDTWWVTGGIVQWKQHRFFAASVHLGPAKKGAYIGAANAFLDVLNGLKIDLPMVIGGDWNLTVGERQPDELLPLTKPGKRLLDRMREEFGLVSGWSLCNPGAPLAQTLRFVGNRSLPFHCDGIFVSAEWQEHLQSATVFDGELWCELSDHNPVVVELVLPAAG